MAREYNFNMMPGESYQAYYKRIAKVADQRLVRLEKLSQQEGFEGAWKWSYNKAMKDIERWGGTKRFNTKAPENLNQLKAKINDIQAFLGSVTSTKSGIVEVYKSRAETFNKKYDMKWTWQDMARFFDEVGTSLYDEYGSDVINKVISIVQSMQRENPDLDAKTLHKMAQYKNKKEIKFRYIKQDGTDGKYDLIADKVMHKIFTQKSDIETLYEIMTGR